MDSKYLQLKFLSFLKRNKHDFSFENKFLFERESDIISCKDNLFYEYEFKIGVSDFNKDIKKNRHQCGKPHYFYYIVSDVNIVSKNALEYAGIYVHKFSSDGQSLFRLIKEPKLIRNEPIILHELYKLLIKI